VAGGGGRWREGGGHLEDEGDIGVVHAAGGDIGREEDAAPAHSELLRCARSLRLALLRMDLEDGCLDVCHLAEEGRAEASLARRRQEDHHLVLGLLGVLSEDGGRDGVKVVNRADRHLLLDLLIRLRPRPDAIDHLVRRPKRRLCQLSTARQDVRSKKGSAAAEGPRWRGKGLGPRQGDLLQLGREGG
jgi:hypothetical protein